jgi:oxygen-dependent protoporphyrinogen oxidase
MKHIVVIGGGIAGLSAAYYLQKYSLATGNSIQVTVLEADSHWGGKILTERVEGFVIEGGPDTFLASKPWGVALCKELDLDGRLHGTNQYQKNTYVLHRGRLQPLPDGLAMMIPTNIQAILRSGLLTFPQKARMGLDYLIPPRALDGDESLGSFVSRRLGRAAYENLIEPLMSGIYAGDGDALSLESTFPYLRDLETTYGSLARGALEMRRKLRPKITNDGKSVSGWRSAFLTPTTGLAELVEALVTYLVKNGVDLRLNTPAERLKRGAKGFMVEVEGGSPLEPEAVILAAPAYASGTLLASFDPLLAKVLQSIPYVSTATVTLAYRLADLPRPLDGYGYVIPRREGRRALACTWTSTKFPHRAPPDCALLRVFIGRAGQENDIPWDEASLLELAREELALTLGITADPLLARVFFWEKAMPQYNLGHPEKLAQIDAILQTYPGLALAGNGYRGIGIPDCIHSGELAAEKILAFEIQRAPSL